jgi:hypothetical protein
MPLASTTANFAQSRVTTDAIASIGPERAEHKPLPEKIAKISKSLRNQSFHYFFGSKESASQRLARGML